MRLRKARLAPIAEKDLTPAQNAALAGWDRNRVLPHVLTTMAHTPDALQAFGVWANHLINQRVLPPRQREIVILRIGFLCRSGYEFAQHTRIGLAAGLTMDEIARIKQGAAAWDGPEAALIRACDDIVASHFITNEVWRALASEFTEEQIAYVVYVASQYVQVSIILNAFGVQVEPTLSLDPDLAAFAD